MIKTKRFDDLLVSYGVNEAMNYFSITASTYGMGGSLHDLIKSKTNEFDDLIALHLSDENGVPMHVIENGLYYIENPEEFNVEVVLKHFRIDIVQFFELDELIDAANNHKERKVLLSDWVNSQKPRWLEEAKAAREKHGV